MTEVKEKKTVFDAGSFKGFRFKPEDIVIIGLDTKDGPEHPLYDERIDLPLDEGMVLSIMDIGVKEPIVVRKGLNGRPEVDDGRRRVMHAREANKRLKKAGDPLVLVPAVVEGGSDEHHAKVSVALNEIRHQDDLLVKAAKAKRMLDRGIDMADVALSFGKSENTIRNWLKLDELAAPVKKAVASGVLTPNAAVQWHGLPREEQLQKLEEAKTQHASTGKSVRSNATKKKPTNGIVPPTKKRIQHVLDNCEVSSEFADALKWVLGLKQFEWEEDDDE